MKIIENTSDKLVIKDQPWLLWIIFTPMGLGAMLAALIGEFATWGETLLVFGLGVGLLLALWKFIPFQLIVFDRVSGSFTHQIDRLNGSVSSQKPLTDIKHAIDGKYSVQNKSVNRIVLQMTDGKYPLEAGFTAFSRDHVIKGINDWLNE